MKTHPSPRPEAFDPGYRPLPLGDLDPRGFEHLVADLVDAEIRGGDHVGRFDRASLLAEGSDEGRDVELLRDRCPVGVIQCKRYRDKVGHETALKEIIKFLLYARLDEARMPVLDGFHYVLATSGGITGKARELFDRWPSSLTDHSGMFPRWVADVCGSFKTFKDLDPSVEAAAVITALPRLSVVCWDLDALSKRVRLRPAVMAIHFKVPMPEPVVAATAPGADAVELGEVSFPDMAVLDGNGLSLCLVQTEPPTKRQIADDVARPATVATLADLLVSTGPDKPVLGQMSDGRVPLVLLPECALGSSDWDAVDALVRGWTRDLVLITGFGVTAGTKIDAWRNGRGETIRRLCDGEEPAADLTYNGGWCWVKHGSTTTCILFLKNYLEQRIETTMVDGWGKSTLRVRFKDLLLCPGICADLLCEVGERSFASRVKRAVAASPPDLKVLVTGSIYQHPPWHGHWTTALSHLTDGMGGHRDRVVVALANHAVHAPEKDEDRDRWRALSGVFGARANGSSFQARREPIRTVLADSLSIAGVVLRRSRACVVAGRIAWPSYGPTTGRSLWPDGRKRRIGPDGRILPGRPKRDPMGSELGRLLERRPPQGGCSASLTSGVQHLQICLECQHCFRAETLAGSCLRGVDATDGDDFPDPDVLHTETCGPGLAQALETLAFLMAKEPGMAWRQERDRPGQHGQLVWEDQQANLLVWSHAGSKTDLKRRLRRWQDTHRRHPPLVVVADTVNGRIEAEAVAPGARTDDISAPTPDHADITSAQGYRRVMTYPLVTVHEMAAEDDPDDPVDVFQEIADLLRKGTLP